MELKKCTICGKTKLTTEFTLDNRKYHDGFASSCKKCLNEKQKIRRSDPEYLQKHNEEKRISGRKISLCLKNLCVIYKHVSSICPVCQKVFFRRSNVYLWYLKKFGVQYCSRECSSIAHTKHWQQNHSEYAKKIKKLLKVY